MILFWRSSRPFATIHALATEKCSLLPSAYCPAKYTCINLVSCRSTSLFILFDTNPVCLNKIPVIPHVLQPFQTAWSSLDIEHLLFYCRPLFPMMIHAFGYTKSALYSELTSFYIFCTLLTNNIRPQISYVRKAWHEDSTNYILIVSRWYLLRSLLPRFQGLTKREVVTLHHQKIW